MTAKPWYRSKTIWFNAAVVVFGALAANQEQLRPLLSAQTYSVLGMVVGLVNTMLRLVTTQPIQPPDEGGGT
jgi:hypothetical protein